MLSVAVGGCIAYRDRQHRVSAVYQASFGENRFLLTYPPALRQRFPDHVPRLTAYGRLAGTFTLVNVDISLVHDEKARGCECARVGLR